MKVAFYAPMKPPDHPVASGDRALARGLVAALRLAGHDVQVASRLRTFDRAGDERTQAQHARDGAREASRLFAEYAKTGAPDAWFTYHLHHKAPDHVGPRVARALDLPYLVAEASIAPRQANGRWRRGHEAALAAIRDADAVLFLNPADAHEVRKARAPDAPWFSLAPFVDAQRFLPAPGPRPPGPVRIATVAMMREGAKLASYRMLAAALTMLRDHDFRVVVVGDGPARREVEAMLAPLAGRIALAGARDEAGVAAALRECDLLAWPAVDEAIGIALLEAQACGLPVVSGRTPGVAGVVVDECTGLLTPPGNVEAFAAALRRLVVDASLCVRMGQAAAAHVRARHDLPQAAARLDSILRAVVSARRPAPPPLPPGLSAALP